MRDGLELSALPSVNCGYLGGFEMQYYAPNYAEILQSGLFHLELSSAVKSCQIPSSWSKGSCCTWIVLCREANPSQEANSSGPG